MARPEEYFASVTLRDLLTMTERTPRTNETLNIAMIAACPFPYPRGTPVRIHRLANALALRGHEVEVFTYHLGEDDYQDPITIHRIPRVSTYTKFTPGPSLQKLLILDPLLSAKLFLGLTHNRTSVIHAHHYEGLLVARVARIGRRLPVIYDAHMLLGSELAYYDMGLPKSLVARLGRGLDRWLPRLSDHVVSVTATIRDKLVDYGMSPDDVSVIENGVEHEIFAEYSDSLPNPDEPPKLIFTGNLASYQGIDLMLRAFAKVVQEKSDVRLLLVTGSSFEPYEGLATELGIRGQLDFSAAAFSEQPKLIADAAVALNPRTDCDGVPQKLLNYMAAGRATVSFEGSAPCIEHGRTGWTVESGDIDAFAAAVVKLLDEPELTRRLGQQARATIVADYGWDIAAAKSEAVYLRLLGER